MKVAAFAICLALAFASVQTPALSGSPKPPPQAKPAATSADIPVDQQLLAIRRVYVESFGEDVASKQIQSMVIASLTDSKRIVVTENKDRADAVLKGSPLEKTSQELHAHSEGTVAGRAAIQDSSASTETIDRVQVSVRLVNHDGDVIWSSTQESKGAKYKGASADVADKVVKQLLHDIDKAQRKPSAAAAQ